MVIHSNQTTKIKQPHTSTRQISTTLGTKNTLAQNTITTDQEAWKTQQFSKHNNTIFVNGGNERENSPLGGRKFYGQRWRRMMLEVWRPFIVGKGHQNASMMLEVTVEARF